MSMTDRLSKMGIRKGLATWAEEADTLKTIRENQKGKLYPFYTKAGEDKEFVLLMGEPLVFDEHYIKEQNASVTCHHEDCKLCASGNKRSVKSGFLVLDLTPYEAKIRDAQGNETGEKEIVPMSVKWMKVNTKETPTFIMVKKHKGDLTYTHWGVSTMGEKTTKVNTFVMHDYFEMDEETEKAIRSRLPEKLRNLSWEDIACEQVLPSEEESKPQAPQAPQAPRTTGFTLQKK